MLWNKIKLLSLMLLFSVWSIRALEVPWSNTSIYNQDLGKVINVEDIDNPIRDWTYMIINDGESNEIEGIVNEWKIQTHNEAKDNVLNIIKNIVNYALGMLGLVALIYLIYNGFLMVTAAGKDDQFKKWIKWLRTAAIALWGIGVSYFVISFIFYLIRYFVEGWPT